MKYLVVDEGDNRDDEINDGSANARIVVCLEEPKDGINDEITMLVVITTWRRKR
jgi:hypothetical protein